MATGPFGEPNSYDLSGHHLHVTYSTSGFDGKPHFSYQDLHQTLDFSGGRSSIVMRRTIGCRCWPHWAQCMQLALCRDQYRTVSVAVCY